MRGRAAGNGCSRPRQALQPSAAAALRLPCLARPGPAQPPAHLGLAVGLRAQEHVADGVSERRGAALGLVDQAAVLDACGGGGRAGGRGSRRGRASGLCEAGRAAVVGTAGGGVGGEHGSWLRPAPAPPGGLVRASARGSTRDVSPARAAHTPAAQARPHGRAGMQPCHTCRRTAPLGGCHPGPQRGALPALLQPSGGAGAPLMVTSRRSLKGGPSFSSSVIRASICAAGVRGGEGRLAS